jgi:aspartate aminotransferase
MNNITISQRAKNTPASAIRKLVPLAEKAKEKGIKVYHLNIGQPDLPTPQEVLDYIHNFTQKTLQYAPSAGIKEAVLSWQKFYADKGMSFEQKDIVVTAGGSEALLFAFMTVCDPGDEILIFEPFYTSYSILTAMGNISFRPILTTNQNGYHLPDAKTIEKAITKKTKAIIICNPNNPTGTLYTEEEVQTITSVVKKYNLFLISDETYQEIVFDGKKVIPFAKDQEIAQNLIICDSVSKRFNSCGARVGCVVSQNQEFMSAVLRLGQGRLSVATVEQLAFIALLQNHKNYTDSIKKVYQSRRDVVVEGLKKIPGATFKVPEGAFYIMPKLPIDDSDRFAEFLLNDFSDNKETVMIAPATGFYSTPGLGKDEIRIAYVLDEESLKRSIELLGLAIRKYNRV